MPKEKIRTGNFKYASSAFKRSIELLQYKRETQQKFNNSIRPWSIVILLALFAIGGGKVFAQSIVTIPVETGKNALILQTDKEGRLGIVYFGTKLLNSKEYATLSQQYNFVQDNSGRYNGAYTPAGTFNLVEPAVQVTHADGNTSLE